MNARKYEELEEMLCKEAEKIIKTGELTTGSLDTIDKIMHTLKNTYKVHMGELGEYSQTDGNSYGNGYGTSYANGNSYARGGYSRTSYAGNGNGNSYARGRYSMARYSATDEAKEEMLDKLEEMMSNAPDEHSKEIIRSAITKLDR